MTKSAETIEVPLHAPSMSQGLIGHSAQWQRMLDPFSNGQGGHGYILAGTDGIGKATFAYQAAKKLLCGDGVGDEKARKTNRLVAGLAHPDLLILDSGCDASKWPIVPVADVRRAVQFLARTAAGGGRRVVIVDKADHLNRNAANALLKVLEEPPAGTVLFLICDRPGGLLATLRSRCQIIRFSSLEQSEMKAVFESLASRGVMLPDGPLQDSAIRLARGSPGVAFRILEHDLASVLDLVDAWLDPAKPANPMEAQKLAAKLTPRDSHYTYALAMERLRIILHEAVRHRLAGSQRVAAAQFWVAFGHKEADVESFNLDRLPFILWALNAARETVAANQI